MKANQQKTLDERMESNYENRFQYSLPLRTYTIIRVEGCYLNEYLKNTKQPFCDVFINTMNETAREMCKVIAGAKLAYVQSDKISILVTDFDNRNTTAWYNNDLQKICSVSAGLATINFNQRYNNSSNVLFSSRVFQISEFEEVVNYFKWRYKIAVKSSIQAVANYNFPQIDLEGKSPGEMKNMLRDVDPWLNYDCSKRNGRFIFKNENNRWEIFGEYTSGDISGILNGIIKNIRYVFL